MPGSAIGVGALAIFRAERGTKVESGKAVKAETGADVKSKETSARRRIKRHTKLIVSRKMRRSLQLSLAWQLATTVLE